MSHGIEVFLNQNAQEGRAMSEREIEKEIQAKGLTAPRITPADIEANIASEFYFTGAQGADGAAGYQQDAVQGCIGYDQLRLLTFCVLVLRNGFTVTGESACASPENFDAELGRKIARANAVNKVWPLMGYALKEQLHRGEGVGTCSDLGGLVLTEADAIADLNGEPRPDAGMTVAMIQDAADNAVPSADDYITVPVSDSGREAIDSLLLAIDDEDVCHMAELCHEANRAYCKALGDDSQLPWADAPDWQRTSAIKGVEFHIANPDAGPSHSHDSWLEQKRAEGWKYGPVKDAEKKEHPCFVPYDELPAEQKAKDYIFGAIVKTIVSIHMR